MVEIRRSVLALVADVRRVGVDERVGGVVPVKNVPPVVTLHNDIQEPLPDGIEAVDVRPHRPRLVAPVWRREPGHALDDRTVLRVPEGEPAPRECHVVQVRGLLSSVELARPTLVVGPRVECGVEPLSQLVGTLPEYTEEPDQVFVVIVVDLDLRSRFVQED